SVDGKLDAGERGPFIVGTPQLCYFGDFKDKAEPAAAGAPAAGGFGGDEPPF
ncbi:MAG: hypothetical protein HRT62_18725, partial [Epibacterium sp.]|nr:hypothetical protein [Epibacterium sp.]